ncbi:glucosyl-dolichyl phosphate glucuronosyltransferase [Halovenus halobia]|uniref:glucosyl-dolichyl phosphate glucuronosyltransferase n=1 Tax=Halovenus halobia TaxID=3396622 RepID=UPI003F568D62
MEVSVVVCTYDSALFSDFVEAVESLLDQTYDSVEIILVIDGNESVYESTQQRFAGVDSITVILNEQNRGLSYSRTRGVEQATGDVIAFIDDDAVADSEWITELVKTYVQTNAIAVGGPMVPEWVADRPSYLPEEFFWLIGVNHKQPAEALEEVRNTFGSNMSFRSTVFEEIGGFDENVGLTADSQIQADETELAIRMQRAFNKGMVYQPDAVVRHKIFQSRTDPRWLCRRAFWQGYSKRILDEESHQSGSSKEQEFISNLVFSGVPRRFRRLATERSIKDIEQLCMLLILTTSVGMGYLFAVAQR